MLTRIARPPGRRAVRRRRDPAFVEIGDDRGVEAIELIGREIGLPEAETDDVERERRQQAQPRVLEHAAREMLGLAAVRGDYLAQAPRAVLLEGKPDLERAEAARQLGAEIAEPGLAAREPAGRALEI